MGRFATIVCVDDEPDIRTVLAASLEYTLGARVTALSSAAALFSHLDEHGVPDLIVLDGMMPETDGYQACEQLRADPRYARVPIVFLTARADQADRDRAIATGATACLAKPFDPLTVGQAIADAIDGDG